MKKTRAYRIFSRNAFATTQPNVITRLSASLDRLDKALAKSAPALRRKAALKMDIPEWVPEHVARAAMRDPVFIASIGGDADDVRAARRARAVYSGRINS